MIRVGLGLHMADAHDLAVVTEPAPQPVSIMLLVSAAAPISDKNVLLFMNGILSFHVFSMIIF